MEQNTTNGTIGVLTLTWLIIKIGIASVLATIVVSAVCYGILWIWKKVESKKQ